RDGSRSTFAVGEDVEASGDELGEGLGRPASPVEADRRASVVTDKGTDRVRDSCELSGERGSRRGLPHEQPVTEAVTDIGVNLAGHGDAHAGEVRLGDVR